MGRLSEYDDVEREAILKSTPTPEPPALQVRIFEEVLAKANETYAYRKLGTEARHIAPTFHPQIQSDQVLAALEVLLEEIRLSEERR